MNITHETAMMAFNCVQGEKPEYLNDTLVYSHPHCVSKMSTFFFFE